MKTMKALFLGCLVCLSIYAGGCYVTGFLTPESPPDANEVIQGYRNVALNQTTSIEALAAINLPNYELVSQSKNVIASAGAKKDGYERWFTMVGFNENELTAKRKYLLTVDERPKFLFVSPWEGLSFDCKMIFPAEVLNKPYNNENARRIAVIRQVLESFRKDIKEVNQDNKVLSTTGMMVNQAFETVLVQLDASPAQAAWLDDPNKGVEFHHINMDRGKIFQTISDDTVIIRMRLGSYAKKFKLYFEQEALDPEKVQDPNITRQK